ncbi:hypothetical protein N6H14_09450 [Paenibacillus sp. CC-CFT747]|nr:hypothetical protein N6H14_09450 [Paenibacillus sp. CC-CFT747]
MQNYEEAVPLSTLAYGQTSPYGEAAETGSYCGTTRRIVIVSPRPALLYPVVLELTARCYDVMLFHHADEAVLGLANGAMLLVDRTQGDRRRFGCRPGSAPPCRWSARKRRPPNGESPGCCGRLRSPLFSSGLSGPPGRTRCGSTPPARCSTRTSPWICGG